MKPTNLKIDGDRLWRSLMEMAEIGGTPQGGVCRLALTDEDRQGRDLFIKWCEEAGCTIRIDQMGNIFARRAGSDDSLPPIMTGSHLDTVPTGGKFDGVLGVLAGLEVMRTLNDLNYVTRAPVELAVWTNEEGSRFSPAMVSSGVFAGTISMDEAKARTDKRGLTLGDELQRIGYEGSDPVGGRPVSAFFELHIEQGPILENEEKTIGVVTGTQAMRWYEIGLTGQDAHAGTTPMEARKDALLGAAEIIQLVERIALGAGPLGRGTVGFITAEPNGRNVITGKVFMCVDLRNPDDAILAEMADEFAGAVTEIAARHRLELAFKEVIYTPAVAFAPECVEMVRQSAVERGLPWRDIVSGAGHDSVYLAEVAPTAMIFVPCLNGLSHNEAESATPEDCAAGCDVLLDAMLAYDAKLA
ncbi:MAG: Zn-dependent hydrolase, partial [Parvibaculaceae bacterium]|nr:Zn-dependent hydrolase [Parvibaculaceae bacterium]